VRSAWADVHLDAIAANVEAVARVAAPARVCAVVKADAYGHGAVPVARAVLDAGASWLAVALADEGETLRDAGIDAPILLLSEPSAGEIDLAVACDLRLTVGSEAGAAAAVAAAEARTDPVPIHLKVDTGMHRVGVAPSDAVAMARTIASAANLRLEGLWTHCAVADEPDRPETMEQLARFCAVVEALDAEGLRPPMLHAANSAATLAFPGLRFDMVRAGIALYGIAPGPDAAGLVPLRPALSLRARVSAVRHVRAGDGVSYGHRWHAPADTVIATVPIGYADGVRRNLGLAGGTVLIAGHRRPIVGVVTMDQLMVDCGPDGDVGVGDDVVLIGEQGRERVTAEEWAGLLDTIGYEIVCGIGARIERRYP
jgi:alanine racemase